MTNGATFPHRRSQRHDPAIMPAQIRVRVLFLAAFCLWLVLVSRLVKIQVIDGENYRRIAMSQHQTILELPSERGAIYDSKLNPMALNMPATSYYAVPEEITDTTGVLQAFQRWCDRDPQDLYPRLAKPGVQFVWLSRKVSPTVEARIDSLHLAGVYKFEERSRRYPFHRLASHVVGFTGVDNQGLSGLESKYNDLLSGKTGKAVFQRDVHGKGFFLTNNPFYQQPQDGSSLILTLDTTIQSIVETELRTAVERTNAHHGMVLVMDPRTSDVLAMANYPDFDPHAATDTPLEYHRNRCVTDQIEPGSTYKIVAATAALEEGLFTPEDSLFCEMGYITISDRKIRDTKPHGWLSFRQILEKSSNVGVIKIAQQLQSDRLYEYSRAYGFGALTGIELPSEVKGLVRSPREWSMFSLASVSIGQELSVTPLQLANAFCALANGGLLMEPHIIKEIRDDQGNVVYQRQPKVIRQVASFETVRTLSDILVGVVERGTGKKAHIPGILIAGKTGTAQKSDPIQGGYKPNAYVASFAGFLPADDPKLVVLVILDEPKGLYYGGDVAAPVFKTIVTKILHTPSCPVPVVEPPPMAETAPSQVPESINVPDLRGLPIQQATQHLQQLGLTAQVTGDGLWVTHQTPLQKRVEPGATVALTAEVDRVPDLRRMPLRLALSRLHQAKIPVQVKGSGLVHQQKQLTGGGCLLIGSL